MSKTAIAVLLLLVVAVLAVFGYMNHQRNEDIRLDAREDANTMLESTLPAGDDASKDADRIAKANFDYALSVCDDIFDEAFDATYDGNLFSSANYDEAAFMRELTRRIAERANADGRPEIATAVQRYVDR